MTQKTASPSIQTFKFNFDKLSGMSEVLAGFKKLAFKKRCESERYQIICTKLLQLIQKHKTPCFLLPAIIDFVREVNAIIDPDAFWFSHFEFWLNQHSGLSDEENYLIRAKIVGKHLPREDYQRLFPIGMNKFYSGSHYVTAHGSPDLDTTIASFWGWVDAFGARVSSGLHIWNMPPGGILTSNEAAPLTDVFSETLFRDFSTCQSSLAASSVDFTHQKDLIKKHLRESAVSPDDHERHKYALMVIDDQGYYIGDIRSEDYESIRQIIRLITNSLKWFENAIHNKFIECFSKPKVSYSSMVREVKSLFELKIIQCVNLNQLTEKLHDHAELYLKNILGLKQGLEATFSQLAQALKKLKISKLTKLEKELIEAFQKQGVFNTKGLFHDQRQRIFKSLGQVSKSIDAALDELCVFMESLDIAIQIKRKVFKYSARYVTPSASLDEIQDKMSVLNHLSVVYPNSDGSFWPLGIIKAKDLKAGKLGTVSLRDFCNRSEVSIDSQLEIISVIDHHKTELKTKTPPLAITGDVQSCNILVAEQAFLINDAYNRGNQPTTELNKQLTSYHSKKVSPSILRLQKRILGKILAHKQPKSYFVDLQREFLEYLSFLHAIIDDTDLFSKATKRDVYCIASLVNRMKSICLKKDVEILNFDHIQEGSDFVEEAVREIVTNPEVYQIYKAIFAKREEAMAHSITTTAKGKSFEFFSDTKEQNGCSRIGQSKLFTKNIPLLNKHLEELIVQWTSKAEEIAQSREQLGMHMHMISTIPSADDVYHQNTSDYPHLDMLWIWTSQTPQAIHHLTTFLSAFKNCPKVQDIHMQIDTLGPSECDYPSIIKHHFMDAPIKRGISLKKKMPIIVLSFDAGTLNSRKAQITPYLPSLAK